MTRKGAGTTLAMAPHASSPALRPGSHTIPQADGCRPLLFSPSVIKPGFSSVKLDIIAQNRCLGDNFNALQQALRGSKVSAGAKTALSILPCSHQLLLP